MASRLDRRCSHSISEPRKEALVTETIIRVSFGKDFETECARSNMYATVEYAPVVEPDEASS
jgi:hypothetical protein